MPVTTPEPTVRPPSRIAKRRPSSMAIGWISSIVISPLSPGLTLVEDLAEHLDARDDGLRRRGVDADDLDGVARVDDALLDAAGRDGAAAGDREDVLDRHQERTVQRALR